MPDTSFQPFPALDPLAADAVNVVEQLVTLRDWLRYCASCFGYGNHGDALYMGHGTDSAWDESVALVLGALHLPSDSGPAVLDAKLLAAERERIYQLIQRRVKDRIPLPYLLGEAFFAGHSFTVDQRVLIPRSPIAELILDGYSAWFPDRDPVRMLDLCTGSGCIGIASALALPTTQVVVSDISPDALEVARHNIERYDLGSRVTPVESDLFSAWKEGRVESDCFDLIVCNPPYVDSWDLANMPQEFKHEPELALGSGDDGLDFTRRLLAEAADYLTSDGILIVEVGNSERQLCEAYPELPFVWLEFEHGGHGVFALAREDLAALSPSASNV